MRLREQVAQSRCWVNSMYIQAIRDGHHGMTTAQLEEEKQARDNVIERLRAEMAEIHELLEPRWERAMLESMGPAHLRQRFAVGGVSEVLSLKG